MSSVVISNRNIFNQRVVSIEKNKVILPFNVNKEQVKKLVDLLAKTKITFLVELDKLNISSLIFNDINVKSSNRQLNSCRFTLSKTYVVTMKQIFISKVESFYTRLVENKVPERPVFNIGKETNLQEALEEATAEIDLSMINASLNINQNLQTNIPTDIKEQPAQVLANNPLGETIIENPINLNNPEQSVVAPAPIVETTPTINNIDQMIQPQVQIPPQENNVNTATQPTAAVQTVEQVASVEQNIPTPMTESVEQPVKKKRRFFSKKGNVLAIPIVAVWLGLVFFGTLKLVTNILTQ